MFKFFRKLSQINWNNKKQDSKVPCKKENDPITITQNTSRKLTFIDESISKKELDLKPTTIPTLVKDKGIELVPTKVPNLKKEECLELIPKVVPPLVKDVANYKTLNYVKIDLAYIEKEVPKTPVFYRLQVLDVDKVKPVYTCYTLSISDLAKAIGVARTTISNHINKTEKEKKVKPLFNGQIRIKKCYNG